MLDWGINILAFILSVLFIVGVHEFGHYWVARRCGVRILRFSIGFGKPLFMWRREGIEYVIGMIPLGGYVSMFGENAGEQLSDEDRKVSFSHKSLPARVSIVAAGPVFNFILAVALYAVVFGIGREDWRPEVHSVIPDSAAAAAGIVPGDEIVAIDGRETEAWSRVMLGILRADSGSDESLLTLRNAEGVVRNTTLDLTNINLIAEENRSPEVQVGIFPWQPPALVGGIHAQSPADASELREGDTMVVLNHEPVSGWHDFVRIVQANPDSVLPVVVEREGSELAFDLPVGARGSGENRVGYAGIAPGLDQEAAASHRTMVRDGPVDAVVRAVVTVGDMLVVTLHALGALIVGEAALTTLSGPVTIAQYAGLTLTAGLTAFFSLLALLSLSIGVINLLPIPMLDGGHLLYYFIEWVKGSPVSERMRSYGQLVGVVLVAGLIGVALYSDVYRLFG